MNDFNISDLMDISGLPGTDFDDSMPAVYEPTVLTPVQSNPKDRSLDLEADYSLVRENLNHQQVMIMDMAKIALENAKNSDSPRHVEVFAGLMKTLNDTSKSIVSLHKEMQAITNEVTKTKSNEVAPQPQMNINTATVFVGTPADLMAMEGSQMETAAGNTYDSTAEEA